MRGAGATGAATPRGRWRKDKKSPHTRAFLGDLRALDQLAEPPFFGDWVMVLVPEPMLPVPSTLVPVPVIAVLDPIEPELLPMEPELLPMEPEEEPLMPLPEPINP